MPVYAECYLLPRFSYTVKVKIVHKVGHHAILTYLNLYTLSLSARYGSMVGLMFGNHFPQRNNFSYSLFCK